LSYKDVAFGIGFVQNIFNNLNLPNNEKLNFIFIIFLHVVRKGVLMKIIAICMARLSYSSTSVE
jgi:hypothetical protein